MRIFAASLLCFTLLSPAWAEKVEVDLNSLDTDTQRRILAARTADAKTSWGGLGKEVGVAINDALGAVVGNAEKFGATSVGHFTMFLVFWKIAGKQIMEIIIGFCIMVVVDSTIIWSYRRTCIPYRILVKQNADKSREWTIIQPRGDDATVWGNRIVHLVTLVAVSLISFALMFA